MYRPTPNTFNQKATLSIILLTILFFVSIASATPPGVNGDIYYIKNQLGGEVYSIPWTGGTPQLRLPDARASLSGGRISLSGDGQRITYVINQGVGTTDYGVLSRLISGGAVENVSGGANGIHDSEPSYCPNGDILFTSGRAGELLPSDLYVRRISTNSIDRLTTSTLRPYPSYSDCGASIIAMQQNTDLPCENGGSGPCYNWQIWTMPAAGGTTTQITSGNVFGAALSPNISPDGTKIAFVGRPRGATLSLQHDWSVWIMNIDGSGAHVVQKVDNTASIDTIVWSPDGTLLAFSRFGVIYIISSSLADSPATALPTPVTLPNGHFPGSIAWSNISGTVDPGTPGGPTDNCPSDQLKTEPGICGCAKAESDSNKDTIIDCGKPRTFSKSAKPNFVSLKKTGSGKAALVIEKFSGQGLSYEITITGPKGYKKLVSSSSNKPTIKSLLTGKQLSFKVVLVQKIPRKAVQKSKASSVLKVQL